MCHLCCSVSVFVQNVFGFICPSFSLLPLAVILFYFVICAGRNLVVLHYHKMSKPLYFLSLGVLDAWYNTFSISCLSIYLMRVITPILFMMSPLCSLSGNTKRVYMDVCIQVNVCVHMHARMYVCVAFSTWHFNEAPYLFSMLFLTFNWWGIINVHNMYGSPPSYSLLIKKTRYQTHYIRTRVFSCCFKFHFSFHYTCNFTLHVILLHI